MTGRGRAGAAAGGRSRAARRLPFLAAVGAMLGLVVYLLPVYAAAPRPGPGGAGDRTHAIVFSRHRQAQLDVVADDRPLPRPTVSAVPPACVPEVLAPAVAGGSVAGDAVTDLASGSAPPGRPRSPPAL